MTATRILVVDDEADIRGLLKEILSEEGYDVSVAGNAAEARSMREAASPDLVLLDIWMPDTDGITLLREWSGDARLAPCPVVMMSGHGTVDTAVEATRLGAFDFIEKPLSLAKLLRTVERALESARSVQQRSAARRLAEAPASPVGKSPAMQGLREQVEQVAGFETAVTLVGEPGSGRGFFARYLHGRSPRAKQPYVHLVAAGVNDEQAAEMLFGREEGEDISPGYLERASRGTLFIDELEDLGAEAQRLLIGALETGVFSRVGSHEPQSLTCRFVSSATPGFESRSGFRRDLAAQLDVVTLRVPPLREYAEDVPELLRYYVDQLVDRDGLTFRRIGVAAQNRLRNYPWPGNVKQLKNLVHRLLIMGGDEEVGLEEIEVLLEQDRTESEPLLKQDLLALPLREAREQFERAYLQQQLTLCGGKVGQLAKRVGMERTHLYRKLRSLGIDFRQAGSDD
jgi:DNA-binding NtrC family response regulator